MATSAMSIIMTTARTTMGTAPAATTIITGMGTPVAVVMTTTTSRTPPDPGGIRWGEEE